MKVGAEVLPEPALVTLLKPSISRLSIQEVLQASKQVVLRLLPLHLYLILEKLIIHIRISICSVLQFVVMVLQDLVLRTGGVHSLRFLQAGV